VVYILPVEPHDRSEYGDGLIEVSRHCLHNELNAIFVAPTFSHSPWYADHPTDPEIRQESYLMDVILPFVEARYPVRLGPSGRLVLGFSKSGWGAYSLLLRHPDTFAKAAVCDAPLMMDRPDRYGSGTIFGSRENFERYQITTLLQKRASELRCRARLALIGCGIFRSDHEAIHHILDDLKIPHAYENGRERKHTWGSGWVPGAARWLVAGSEKPVRMRSVVCQPDRDSNHKRNADGTSLTAASLVSRTEARIQWTGLAPMRYGRWPQRCF
jgi:hypothetical protein